MLSSFPGGVAHLPQPMSRGMAGKEHRNSNQLLGTRSICAAECVKLHRTVQCACTHIDAILAASCMLCIWKKRKNRKDESGSQRRGRNNGKRMIKLWDCSHGALCFKAPLTPLQMGMCSEGFHVLLSQSTLQEIGLLMVSGFICLCSVLGVPTSTPFHLVLWRKSSKSTKSVLTSLVCWWFWHLSHES